MARKERRFTFESGKSAKFWSVRVDGASLTVRFGRIGTPGQEQTKRFDDARGAELAAQKLVREKTAKGYREAQGHVAATEAAKARREPVREKGRARGSGERHDRGSSRPKAKRKSREMPWGPGNPRFEALVEGFTRFQEEAGAYNRSLRERSSKLPRRVERPLDWDELESEIRKEVPRRATNRDRKLSKSVPGLATTPPSYVEFVSRFEDIFEWRLAFQKRHWPPYFNLLGKRIPETRASLNSTYKTDAPRKAQRVAGFIPFATDVSKTWFCWDSTATDERSEPPVYAVDYKHPFSIRRLGGDFLEVIQHYRPGGPT
jgi:predicted DNA-binding WGR domain protein